VISPSTVDATSDLTRVERWSPEAKHGKLCRNAFENDRVRFALRLQLGVTSTDELIDVQAQHVEYLVHRA